MLDRLTREFESIKTRYPRAGFREEGLWILLPGFLTPIGGWQQQSHDVCFQVRSGYPDISPYGIYASPFPRSAQGETPQNYTDNAEPHPPFPGTWGKFSWELEGWRATPDIVSGSTLLNYVESIRKRFEQGI